MQYLCDCFTCVCTTDGSPCVCTCSGRPGHHQFCDHGQQRHVSACYLFSFSRRLCDKTTAHIWFTCLLPPNNRANSKQKWDFERISGLRRAGAKIDSTEIVAFHPSTRHVFVANPQDNSVDVAIMNKDGTLADVERIQVEAGFAPNTGECGDVYGCVVSCRSRVSLIGLTTLGGICFRPLCLSLIPRVQLCAL